MENNKMKVLKITVKFFKKIKKTNKTQTQVQMKWFIIIIVT